MLVNPVDAEKRPWQMFFLGILFSSLAIILSVVVFSKHSSLVMVFLTVLASFPIVYNTIKLEEYKDEHAKSEIFLLKEHAKALEVFMFLFVGILISCTLWFVFLPPDYATQLFSVQVETIHNINSVYLGNVISDSAFTTILTNNLRVLSICILFSFLYGVGALFILTWNATVIATAMGAFVRENIATISSTLGSVSVAKYFHAFSLSMLRYMTHGVFEIMAYFIAALAGGIISVAVIRHVFGSKQFERIVFDVSELLIISVALLLVSAVIEVFVTPVLF